MFSLDRENPGRKMRGENDLAYKLFTLWLTGSTGKELAELADVSPSQISKLKETCCWSVRKMLIEGQAKLAQVVTLEDEITEKQKYDSRYKAIPNSRLPLPPAPIQLSILEFAEKFAPVICPGYVLDDVARLMLTEMGRLAEGKITRLIINPAPRSSKTLSSIIAMAWGILRDVGRSNILLSANQRLSAINNQMLKDLVLSALPDGYELSQDTNSKLGWKIGCQHAGIQVALSRGASLLGYTASGCIYIDDILGSVAEAEKPELLETVRRTIAVDAMTRLTPWRGKQAGLCIVSQRLGRNDPTGQLIEAQRAIEAEGGRGTQYTVVACPFAVPSKERQAEIVGDYPDNWIVKMPQFDYSREGQPVSERFTEEFLESLRMQLPPADFACLYELNLNEDAQWSAWKRDYIKPVAASDIDLNRGTFAAIDMSLSGGDDSAMVIGTVVDGRIVITGLHILPPDIDEALPAIVNLAKEHNCVSIGVERAASGAYIMKSLGNNIGGRHWNIVALSHEGRNKQSRQAKILGLGANDKIWILEGLELTEMLHTQMRAVAMGRKRAKDDLQDAAVYCINWLNEHWLKAGYAPSTATWGHSGGNSSGTPCVWGRGTHAGLRPQVGIDGVERYSLPGFS